MTKRHLRVPCISRNGLDERGAIERLAAEEAATDLYRRVQGMNIPGYAGAWFDADSQKLHVALSDMTPAQMLSKFGAAPVQVAWSLAELGGLQRMIGDGETGLGPAELRKLYVDPRTNRVQENPVFPIRGMDAPARVG